MSDFLRASDARGGRSLAWSVHGWVGVILVALMWPLNWTLSGPRTHLLFFPLWLGFILLVDAIVLRRSGTSLLTRTGFRFPLLFVASVPLWWIFELINARTKNWHYAGVEYIGDVEYAVLASVAFSTVIPAVLEAAELMSSFSWSRHLEKRWRFPSARKAAPILFAGGWISLAAILIWPATCYPLLWGSLFAILEPINVWLQRPSILKGLERRDWSRLVVLSTGTLLCGFFWEMWNVHSFPKWRYITPGADFWHVFEMPLLGYIGYLPFGWEVYAFTHLVLPTRITSTLSPSSHARI